MKNHHVKHAPCLSDAVEIKHELFSMFCHFLLKTALGRIKQANTCNTASKWRNRAGEIGSWKKSDRIAGISYRSDCREH